MSANTYGVSDEQITRLDVGETVYVDAYEEVTVLGVVSRLRRVDVERSDGTLDSIAFDQVALSA